MNNLSIADWTAVLERLMPDDCKNQRPFVCDGFSNPTDCDVLIIGKEPATRLGVDWREQFWNPQPGFRHRTFQRVYAEARLALGKTPQSKTRQYFDLIKAMGLNCIETNVYRNEGSKKYISRKFRVCNRAVVQALIDNIPQLKGIIAHGVPAKACLPSLKVPDHVKRLPMAHFTAREKGHTADYVRARLDAFCATLRGES